MVEWTSTLVEFRHSCGDSDCINSYGGRIEPWLSCILLFRPDTSYKSFERKQGIASVFESWKHWIMIGSQPSNLARILVAPFPGPQKYHFKGQWQTSAVKQQQFHNQEISKNVFMLICCPFDAHLNTARFMLRVDVQIQECHPAIYAWTAEYFEKIHFHWIMHPDCPLYKAPKSSFGEGNSLSWQLRLLAILPKVDTHNSGRWDRRSRSGTISGISHRRMGVLANKTSELSQQRQE